MFGAAVFHSSASVFVTHVTTASRNGWSSQAPARRVTERAQEMFLEYAHYLPERATARVVARMKQAVAAALRSLDLSRPLDAAGLLAHASTIHSGRPLSTLATKVNRYV